MTCEICREQILDFIGKQHNRHLRDHLLVCPECRRFHESQQALHAYFVSASAANLSPAFRDGLGKRLANESVFAWPDFLPDIAHLTGCAIATLVSVFVLPWPTLEVLFSGTIFTGLTYLLQSTVRDALQAD
jgi:hypothetical protein